MENKIRTSLMSLLAGKLFRLGIRDSELGDHFDLVKSGLMNSLEFVEMVAKLEKEYQCEIDFETALANGDLTTIGGVIRNFANINHG
jgi:acyl carrier protein